MFAPIITPGNGVWQWHLQAGACLRIGQVQQQVRAGLPSRPAKGTSRNYFFSELETCDEMSLRILLLLESDAILLK